MTDGIVEEYTAEDVGTLHVDGSITTGEQRFTVTLPNKEDSEAVSQFIASLTDKQAVHGVKSLLKWTDKYLDHVNLAETMWQKAIISANNVNGIRTRTQIQGDKKKSLRHTAEVFYGSLSTSVLRVQCTAFGLNFDGYETIEDVVAALVEKSVEVTVV